MNAEAEVQIRCGKGEGVQPMMKKLLRFPVVYVTVVCPRAYNLYKHVDEKENNDLNHGSCIIIIIITIDSCRV